MLSFSSRFARRSVVAAVCAALFFPVLLVASKNFVKPVARAAINYPAHDFHRDSKVAIAADPYDTPEKAKIFIGVSRILRPARGQVLSQFLCRTKSKVRSARRKWRRSSPRNSRPRRL